MNIKKLYVVPFLSLMCLSLGSWSFNDIVGKFSASSFNPSSISTWHGL